MQRFLVVWRIAASPIFSRAKETGVQNKELRSFANRNAKACAANAEMLQCPPSMKPYIGQENKMEINRDSYLDQLTERKHNGLVKVITGLRRVGKSFLLFNRNLVTGPARPL